MIPITKIFKGERTEHTARKMGPLFVWNVTSRCNLSCGHCYRDSAPGNQPVDLTDERCLSLAQEIKSLNPPIVLLTGGEPLLRKNIFDIIKRCKDVGLRVGLSTNGTLIDENMAKKISAAGVDYVGISVDGKKESHDRFRGLTGAFDASWQGIQYLNEHGVKTGVRFTLTKANSKDLWDILDKTVQAGVKRFCLYHLVYAGRGSADQDMAAQDKRSVMAKFFHKVQEISSRDAQFDVLTTDNPADGIFMLDLVKDKASAISCVMSHQGCSAGDRVVYLDSTGDVYPCQFLRDCSLGNVLEKPLMEIWQDTNNPLLRQLRNKKDFLEGKCGVCTHKEICGGCRARAKAYHGSLWAEDPACYLTEDQLSAGKIKEVLV
ncbi:MAG: radical SAM protein [Candidatus Omnitrophica bacterium]|nr:radical SAM protein [Candidatus Omnitrophota bacterium]